MIELTSKTKKSYALAFLLIALAAFLCLALYRLPAADPLTDETEVAFRSVGYLDFLATPYQTTPYEWINGNLWWFKLSFHDHPPLTFLIEHVVFGMFSDNLFYLRIIFVIAGLGSSLFFYLALKKIFGHKLAMLALIILITNSYWLWLSRIGLQEGLVIFFVWLNLWCLTKTSDNKLYWFFWAISFGFGLLTKYTAAIILPISLIYILIFKPEEFKRKYFYLGLLLAFAIFSPVLVYNENMYKLTGHFDLQLSTMFKQRASQWLVLPGKNIGSLVQRITNFYPDLRQNTSPVFFFSYLASLLGFVILLIKKIKLKTYKKELFIILILFAYHLVIILIGPSQRFLAMLIPLIAVMLAWCWDWFFGFVNLKWFFGILFFIFIAYQLFFSIQTNLAIKPLNNSSWIFSKLRHESSSWGYNNLENYLASLLDTKKPGIKLELPDSKKFIQDVRNKDYRKISKNPSTGFLIIYDPRLNNVAALWLYQRRYYYDGWPIISADEYYYAQNQNPNFFSDYGFTDYYYIMTTQNLFTGGNTVNSAAAQNLQNSIDSNNIEPQTTLNDPDQNTIFNIYHLAKSL